MFQNIDGQYRSYGSVPVDWQWKLVILGHIYEESKKICKFCHLPYIDDELFFITKGDFHAIERGHLYEIIQKYVPNVIATNNRD